MMHMSKTTGTATRAEALFKFMDGLGPNAAVTKKLVCQHYEWTPAQFDGAKRELNTLLNARATKKGGGKVVYNVAAATAISEGAKVVSGKIGPAEHVYVLANQKSRASVVHNDWDSAYSQGRLGSSVEKKEAHLVAVSGSFKDHMEDSIEALKAAQGSITDSQEHFNLTAKSRTPLPTELHGEDGDVPGSVLLATL